MFINYAHRKSSNYAPGDTVSSFEKADKNNTFYVDLI